MRNNRSRATFATLVVALGAVVACLHASPAWGQTAPDTVVFQPAPQIDGVIKAGTRPEVVVRGLRSSDDPIWLPNIGLVFSESQANRVVKLDEHDQVATFVGDLHGPLGMTLDRKGRLISLQSQTGFAGPRVIWPRGSETVLADSFEGHPFGRPNDIVSDSKGGVYFSDLPLRPAPPDAMAPAVYYVPPGGSPIRVIDGIARPNGVQLSRDEKILYVNDTGGVHGQHLGVIPVWCITRRCQNLTFGGPDKRTLYVAGGGTLLRIPMLSRGFAGRAK